MSRVKDSSAGVSGLYRNEHHCLWAKLTFTYCESGKGALTVTEGFSFGGILNFGRNPLLLREVCWKSGILTKGERKGKGWWSFGIVAEPDCEWPFPSRDFIRCSENLKVRKIEEKMKSVVCFYGVFSLKIFPALQICQFIFSRQLKFKQ